jgi:predicted  nucleic acid-binding Zn ribbon protein
MGRRLIPTDQHELKEYDSAESNSSSSPLRSGRHPLPVALLQSLSSVADSVSASSGPTAGWQACPQTYWPLQLAPEVRNRMLERDFQHEKCDLLKKLRDAAFPDVFMRKNKL